MEWNQGEIGGVEAGGDRFRGMIGYLAFPSPKLTHLRLCCLWMGRGKAAFVVVAIQSINWWASIVIIRRTSPSHISPSPSPPKSYDIATYPSRSPLRMSFSDGYKCLSNSFSPPPLWSPPPIGAPTKNDILGRCQRRSFARFIALWCPWEIERGEREWDGFRGPRRT